MKSEKILVIGGTGKTGRKVAQKLNSLGHFVRIGSRNANPPFDWEKPETWNETMTGIEKVYITFQPDLAVPGAQNAIKGLTELATKNGIQKLVILSGRGEKEAEMCEQIVIDSQIDYTVVRSDWFNQNFSESFFLDPIMSGHVAIPRAQTKIPFVDTDDIAEVVVASLLDDKHTNKIHELTGPDLWTFKEVIGEIAKATGRDIQFHPISIDEYVEMLKKHQIPDSYIWLINYLFTNVLDGRNSSTTSTIQEVLGRPAKSLTEYVKETARTGVWDV
jgi:uncharacterized protein YbjT (DUF2867 family)